MVYANQRDAGHAKKISDANREPLSVFLAFLEKMEMRRGLHKDSGCSKNTTTKDNGQYLTAVSNIRILIQRLPAFLAHEMIVMKYGLYD